MSAKWRGAWVRRTDGPGKEIVFSANSMLGEANCPGNVLRSVLINSTIPTLNAFGDLVEEARVYVLRVKNFGKDTATFTTEAQENLAPNEEDELLHDWKKSIDRMKEGNDKIEEVKQNFKKVLEKLRPAQDKAAGGAVRGREKADISAKFAETSNMEAGGLAVAAPVAAYVTGGLAAPVLAFGGFLYKTWEAGQHAADSIRRYFSGPLTTSDDSPIQEKHKKWRETYDFVARKLDEAFEIISSSTEDCKKALNELSEDSNRLLDNFEKPLNQKKLERTDYFKRKCIRLREDSEELQQTCIDYIKKDDESRRLTGSMGRLSLQ
ncbi:Hypp1698 [Branchiostoma lanceolatum]|uniref:Hypp1698 protein n=1 Tax=Branchiostoma lanceolatum TaxID=7740 RepID=A0A8K0ELT7_BRALA|nr:Hypp1698 [Branchiostoma lanceolatum]